MQHIYPNQLEALAIGCALLGSGGGGDPAYELLMAKHLIRNPHPVLAVEELADEALLIPVGFMGAPLVIKEKLQTGREFIPLVEAFTHRFGCEPTAIVAAEIGGSNGITPLLAAAQLGIPLLDADTIGRAFPQLQMSTANLHGVSPSPAFFSDSMGNAVTIEAGSARELEHLARHLTVAMGSSCAVGIYPMTGRQAKSGAVIPRTYQKAITLGEALLAARKASEDPVEAIAAAAQGVVLARGAIVDIDQRVERGFLEGSVKIQAADGPCMVHYQNEYLVAQSGKDILAVTPDIIAIVDQETGAPLTSEILRYGIRVAVLAIPSPTAWTSDRGLRLVGPRYFGYECDYQPLNALQERKAS